VIGLKAGRASHLQRRCVLLLGYNCAAASVSAIAWVSCSTKLTENRRFINSIKINWRIDKTKAAFAGAVV